jgi:phage terminase small subunit
MSQVLNAVPIQVAPSDLLTLPQTLTIKQKLFVYHYVQTRNATKSAELAGYAGDQATLASVGWENLRKPEIKSALDELFASKTLSSAEVLGEISDVARVPIEDLAHKDNPGPVEAKDKLKALELLGKHHKLWNEQSETELSAGDVERLSDSIIAGLFEAAQRRKQQEQHLLPASSDPNL